MLGANGGIGYAVEFSGSTIRNLPIEGRLTVCNMAIEFQAKYGFVAADEVTFAYLKGRDFAPKGPAWDQAVQYWRSLATEPGAVFDKETSINCADIRPHVTWGTSAHQVTSIDGSVPNPADAADPAERALMERALSYIQLRPGERLDAVKIDAAFIGSCTNARLSDLRASYPPADVFRETDMGIREKVIDAKPSTYLRKLFAEGPLPVAIVWGGTAHHAQLAEATGFRCFGLSGSLTSTQLLGLPDAAFPTLNDVVENTRRICDAVSIPVMVDCDTG